MSPEDLLEHHDSARLWPVEPGNSGLQDVPAAYQRALAVRALRMARGEQPRGYKVGFTNRGIWQRYNVFAPIWGTIWNTSLSFCEGEGDVALADTCQPRIEPEVVFCMRATPPQKASLDDLFACVDWVATGFEIVQSHQAGWKFAAPDAVADGGLHARLLVGPRMAAAGLAKDAQAFGLALAGAGVTLSCNGKPMDRGTGANVLGDPLQALLYFLQELRACPGAVDLQPGDVITTGTWTDAWPVAPGEQWVAAFDAPLAGPKVTFA
ncbi:2-keto-4-pentenoate hydratase [Polaromonas sp. A23]|uniref:2-keto-4-pentenoate hydratase n=1 Tax=Polaromonas sp. A23 TaxID=1944133 RepID=UPI000985C8F0|nr:fumarylacetoacetate hydrolase family protein [Polaromonas sp. A23]OOG39459.1 hydratase [Polaromonas sp. A23]